jgi:hypothetical protein
LVSVANGRNGFEVNGNRQCSTKVLLHRRRDICLGTGSPEGEVNHTTEDEVRLEASGTRWAAAFQKDERSGR